MDKVIIGTSIRQKWIAESGLIRVVAILMGGFALSRFNPSKTESELETVITILLFLTFHCSTFAAIVSCVIASRLNWKKDDDEMPPSWILVMPRGATVMAVVCYLLAVSLLGASKSEGMMLVLFISFGSICLVTMMVVTFILWSH
eukprot:TRINITY_DN3764_c0_g1_i1.p2 TRINITY_DN3764_c0_g1~~TRINITY_DN3764_c0_g1_i1.p2  ORF type:complete len:145 (-),score=18.98 TRINITY_DN3764_c0_g1_i1:162-596(-)